VQDQDAIGAIIIDDDDLFRSLWEHVMKMAEVDILGVAANGADGLAMFAEKKPAMVLLDIRMPGMDGHEVLTRIRELDPSAYVLMVSAFKDFKTISESMGGGAQDYLRKDLPIEQIVERMKAHVARYRAGDLTTITERLAEDIQENDAG